LKGVEGMEKLIAELSRLYLAPEAVTRDALAQHILGQVTRAIKLTTADGQTRALAIPFRRMAGAPEGQHWTRLCEVANALQAELGLPAPAVSIDGANTFYLWLSLASPVPSGQAQDFLELLRQAYFPEIELAPDAATAPVYLPPSLNPRSGKWAAFIHPGMGASFAEESGLEMAPPLAGQAGFLEGLESIGEEQFRLVLLRLGQGRPRAQAAPEPVFILPLDAEPGSLPPAAAPRPQPQSRAGAVPDGLLLKDATLEDIVRFLHAKNIEPTFRHILPK
jgi:hypothetical protein